MVWFIGAIFIFLSGSNERIGRTKNLPLYICVFSVTTTILLENLTGILAFAYLNNLL